MCVWGVLGWNGLFWTHVGCRHVLFIFSRSPSLHISVIVINQRIRVCVCFGRISCYLTRILECECFGLCSLQVGDVFVLNCLGEGEYSPVMKHFLQRFPPGADRFAGVESYTAACGAPALGAAIAAIECKVMSRMETADHWVTYAEVTAGQVAAADKRTAVHRRKVANYY